MAQEDVDRILELARGERRVKTPAGAKQYGQPIGSVIRADIAPGRRMGAAAQSASTKRLSAGGRDRAVPGGAAGRQALESAPSGTKISSSYHGTLTKQSSGKWDSDSGMGKGFTSAELADMKSEGVSFNFGAAQGRSAERPTAPRPSLAVGRASDARLARAEQQRIRAQAESEMRPAPTPEPSKGESSKSELEVGQAVLNYSTLEDLPEGSRISDPRGRAAYLKGRQGWTDEKTGKSVTPQQVALEGGEDLAIRRIGPPPLEVGQAVLNYSTLEDLPEGSRISDPRGRAAYLKKRGGWEDEKTGKSVTPQQVALEGGEDLAIRRIGPEESSGGEWVENADVTYKGETFKVLKVQPNSRRTPGGMPDPNGSRVRVTVKYPNISKPVTVTLPIELVQKKKKTALSAGFLDETEVLLLTHDDGEVHEEDVVAYSHYLSVARDMGYVE